MLGMTPEKEQYYENATKKLLKTIDSMGLGKIERLQAKNLALLFRDSFKLSNVKHETFWHELGKDMNRFTYDSDGFCRVSSITFLNTIKNLKDWKLMYIGDLWTYGPHHYLMHVPSKQILDLTYDQYTHNGIQIPYDMGSEISYKLTEKDNTFDFAKSIGIDLPNLLRKQKD